MAAGVALNFGARRHCYSPQGLVASLADTSSPSTAEVEPSLSAELLLDRPGSTFIFVVVQKQGNDFLHEQAGMDTNSDLMFGNLGADTFDFSAFSASGQTTATADRIAAFSTAQGDKVEIDVTDTMEFLAISNPSVNSVEAAITVANSVNAFGTADVVFCRRRHQRLFAG